MDRQVILVRRAVADDASCLERDDRALRVAGQPLDERDEVLAREARDPVDRQRGVHDRADRGLIPGLEVATAHRPDVSVA